MTDGDLCYELLIQNIRFFSTLGLWKKGWQENQDTEEEEQKIGQNAEGKMRESNERRGALVHFPISLHFNQKDFYNKFKIFLIIY